MLQTIWFFLISHFQTILYHDQYKGKKICCNILHRFGAKSKKNQIRHFFHIHTDHNTERKTTKSQTVFEIFTFSHFYWKKNVVPKPSTEHAQWTITFLYNRGVHVNWGVYVCCMLKSQITSFHLLLVNSLVGDFGTKFKVEWKAKWTCSVWD